MIHNPLGIMNDGYFDLLFYPGMLGFASAIKLFDGAKSGGTHIYDPRG